MQSHKAQKQIAIAESKQIRPAKIVRPESKISNESHKTIKPKADATVVIARTYAPRSLAGENRSNGISDASTRAMPLFLINKKKCKNAKKFVVRIVCASSDHDCGVHAIHA